MFVRVEFGDIDIDEADGWILKCGFRGAGEIGVARADADDQVGFAREDVCGGSSGYADRADGLRVIVGKRAFAGVCFADGDSGCGGKFVEFARGFGIENAAAGDDQGALCGVNPLCGALQLDPDRRANAGSSKLVFGKKSSGKSKASVWTSCGRESVTVPVSVGEVRTRTASGREVRICSGR